MKILKWLLGLLLFLILLVAVLSFVGPKSFDVSRSVTVNAAKDAVYPYLCSFDQMKLWSPWQELDPAMQQSIEGTDGAAGAKQVWNSDKVGKGEQTFTTLEPGKKVETHLKFFMPWGSSESDAHLLLDYDPAGGTKVTWGMKGENGFIDRAFAVFMNMDAMLGADFEKGLAKLKSLVESEAASITYRGYKVETLDFPGKTYVGIRKNLKWDAMHQFFADNFPKIFAAVADKADGMPSALYFVWDEANKSADMAAAVPVKQAVAGFEKFDIPAGRALLVNFYGNYDKVGNAHLAIDDFMKEKGLKQKTPVVEEYVTDPQQEPDTAKWLTKIFYFVEPQ
jgi:effector-binding domain-containing protein